jgi:hypothetical protein
MSSSTPRAVARLAADARRVFGDRFVALVTYGADASVIFASSVSSDDLDALSPLVEAWHHDGLPTPLVMTPDEFHRSLDAFPLEYQAILDQHTVVDGTPPFAGVSIRPDDLRRACETQARSHLIHLRQGWLQAAAHADQLDGLLVRSATPFRALISNVARLHNAVRATNDDLAFFAERTIGMQASIVLAVLDLERHPERVGVVRGRLPEYLAATSQLWHFVDVWRAA